MYFLVEEEVKTNNFEAQEENDHNSSFGNIVDCSESNEFIPSIPNLQLSLNKRKVSSIQKFKPKEFSESLYFYEFDKMKAFSNYFLNGNFNRIIAKLTKNTKKGSKYMNSESFQSSFHKKNSKQLEKRVKLDFHSIS